VRISHVLLEGSEVSLDVVDDLDFTPIEEVAGERIEGVSAAAVPFVPHGDVRLIRIAVGGYFVLHTGPESGFIQVVRGRGNLVLPGEVRVAFSAPELFLFRPNTLHGWNEIEEETLMAACLVS
jgi:quercetin dioxygenase-like cupin family protein